MVHEFSALLDLVHYISGIDVLCVHNKVRLMKFSNDQGSL